MTADRSADAAVREPRDVMADAVPDMQEMTPGYIKYCLIDKLIAALRAAGYQIRERRSEPVVEIPLDDLAQIRESARIGRTKCEADQWADIMYVCDEYLGTTIARATGDGEGTNG
jgi:hypothetical protein